MNDFLIQIFIPIFAFAVFTGGMIVGSGVTEQDNITKGRNDGIVFCSEKPEQCKIEYSYLKLKETQK